MPDKKVALVTGAGRGIGRAIALELAKRGCTVAVNYSRSEGPANEVVEEITAAGGEAFAVKADVSNAEEVKAMFKAVAEKLGPVNILVCNAGVTRDNLLMRMKDADWDDVIKTDLSSLYYCAKEAVRPMLKGRWGRIVAVSSINGTARQRRAVQLRGGEGRGHRLRQEPRARGRLARRDCKRDSAGLHRDGHDRRLVRGREVAVHRLDSRRTRGNAAGRCGRSRLPRVGRRRVSSGTGHRRRRRRDDAVKREKVPTGLFG